MAALDEYQDGTMDAEDIFPCKGCGEILEEGKAFELGKSLLPAVIKYFSKMVLAPFAFASRASHTACHAPRIGH